MNAVNGSTKYWLSSTDKNANAQMIFQIFMSSVLRYSALLPGQVMFVLVQLNYIF